MRTLLYIVRHGHSKGNDTKTFYGHFDGPLTQKGHEQAQRVMNFFKDKRIDAVYSSDLIRAVDTVKPTAQSKGLEVIGDKRLREIYAGAWENRNIDELIVEYPEEYGVWRNDKANSRCTNGESVRELSERFINALADIAQKNAGKNIIIGTHATPIMLLKPVVLGLPLENMNNQSYVLNASVTTVSYERGKWELMNYGEESHLIGLETVMAKGF